jgi:hypothetical protein
MMNTRKPGTFQAAFYRGTRPGIPGIYNRLVRLRGRGPHSHCELVFSDNVSASSSFADGGVRFKDISYNDDRWDFIDLPPELEAAAREYFQDKVAEGVKYDSMGNVHLVIGFVCESPERLFCSEALMESLGYDCAWRFEPNAAYCALGRTVQLYRLCK